MDSQVQEIPSCFCKPVEDRSDVSLFGETDLTFGIRVKVPSFRKIKRIVFPFSRNSNVRSRKAVLVNYSDRPVFNEKLWNGQHEKRGDQDECSPCPPRERFPHRSTSFGYQFFPEL